MAAPFPYRLEQQLGIGGSGVVYAGVHVPTGIGVAIKTVHTASRAASLTLDRELAAMTRLRHPGILHLYDHGVARAGDPVPEGVAWLALELAHGGSLERWVPTGWPEVLGRALQVLDALAHAHARGLVHRDLKPANLLICSSHDLRPGLKIADFGLAWATDRDRRGIKRAGTPDTISPEQVRGDPTAFGPWTDLYALGAMVWQWVTGRPPFVGPDLESQLQAHLTADLPPLAPRFPVPDGLEDVLAWLLERETVDRPRSAAAVTRALLGLEKGLGLPAQPLPLPTDWRDREPAPVAQLTNAGMGLLGRREHRVVGRGPEQQAVWAALREVAASRSMRVVALVGEPGIGCSHIARWLERRVVEVGAGEGHRIDVETGLPGFAERALGVVVSGVASLGPHATELDQALFARRANPPSLLVLRWLAERASRGPVVVRVDDAHRAPGATLLADALFERLEGPVLFVATGPLESPVWDDLALHAAFSRIPLGGLPDREMEELALHDLGLEPVAARRLALASTGVPGTLVRWVEVLASRELLVPGRGGFTVEGPIGGPPPEDTTARERFEASWSRLEPEDRIRVAVGAVLGVEVDIAEWEATLRELGDGPRESPLRSLWKEGWITRTRTSWRFTSGWVRHHAMSSLPEAALAAVRAAVVDALAGLPRTFERAVRRGEVLIELGRAREAWPELCATLAEGSGQRAWEPVRRLAASMVAAVDLADLPPRDRYGPVRFGFEARRVLETSFALGDVVGEVEALVDAVDGEERLLALQSCAETYLQVGRPDDAARCLAQLPERPRTWRLRGLLALDRGQVAEARALLTRAFHEGDDAVRAAVANALGRLEGLHGEREASYVWFRECATSMDGRQAAVPWMNLVVTLLLDRRPEEAVDAARKALDSIHHLPLRGRAIGALYAAVAAAAGNDRELYSRTSEQALFALRLGNLPEPTLLRSMAEIARETAGPDLVSFLDDVVARSARTGLTDP